MLRASLLMSQLVNFSKITLPIGNNFKVNLLVGRLPKSTIFHVEQKDLGAFEINLSISSSVLRALKPSTTVNRWS